MKRYFIMGTDTDCGKTYVTCQLLDYFKARHQRIIAVKPVASGCFEEGGQLLSDDVLHLQRHSGNVQHQLCPWRFKPPIAPHLAAEEAGQFISSQAIIDFCHHSSFDEFDYQLIEGAGGLMAPLNNKETWLDFLSSSNIPVIFVVGLRLGCLNHALLTELALQVHQIQCVGWIANCLDKDMLALPENIKTLSERLSGPLVATISYGGTLEGDTLMQHLCNGIDTPSYSCYEKR